MNNAPNNAPDDAADNASVPERTERIVVALDASPQSVAALKAAAQLAALMEAELEGLFVEDINLLYLCNFPFCHEVGSYTAHLRRVDNVTIERQLRTMAAAIQDAMTRVATQTPVRWSFHVRRGSVVPELLAAAQSAALMSMGRAGHLRRKSLGSTAQSVVSKSQRPLLILGEGNGLEYPLMVVYTGSPAAQRALQLAVRLAKRNESEVRVLAWGGGDGTVDLAALQQDVEERLAAEEAAGQVVRVSRSSVLLTTIHAQEVGTLVLPGEHSTLLAEHSGPTLLVP